MFTNEEQEDEQGLDDLQGDQSNPESPLKFSTQPPPKRQNDELSNHRPINPPSLSNQYTQPQYQQAYQQQQPQQYQQQQRVQQQNIRQFQQVPQQVPRQFSPQINYSPQGNQQNPIIYQSIIQNQSRQMSFGPQYNSQFQQPTLQVSQALPQYIPPMIQQVQQTSRISPNIFNAPAQVQRFPPQAPIFNSPQPPIYAAPQTPVYAAPQPPIFNVPQRSTIFPTPLQQTLHVTPNESYKVSQSIALPQIIPQPIYSPQVIPQPIFAPQVMQQPIQVPQQPIFVPQVQLARPNPPKVEYIQQKKTVVKMVEQEIEEIIPVQKTRIEYLPVQTIVEKVPVPIQVPYYVQVDVPVPVPQYIEPPQPSITRYIYQDGENYQDDYLETQIRSQVHALYDNHEDSYREPYYREPYYRESYQRDSLYRESYRDLDLMRYDIPNEPYFPYDQRQNDNNYARGNDYPYDQRGDYYNDTKREPFYTQYQNDMAPQRQYPQNIMDDYDRQGYRQREPYQPQEKNYRDYKYL